MKGSKALEIHTCFSECMLFIADLQWVAKTKVKPGRGPGCASCRYAMQAALSILPDGILPGKCPSVLGAPSNKKGLKV